jgi:type IV secretory pathway VirJ component
MMHELPRAGLRASRRALLAALASTTIVALSTLEAQDPAGSVADLPITEIPATAPGRALVLLITGDGGWAAGDRAMARELAKAGVAVVGLDSRAWLRSRQLDPDLAARDAARIFDHYSTLWRRDRLVLVGYSRGAVIAPFIVTRLDPALRRRLDLVAMIGLEPWASFDFHWTDMVTDVRRPEDRPVLPELRKLEGTPMLCLYGEKEKGSLCPQLAPGFATVARHDGTHVLSGSAAPAVAKLVLDALAAH